MSSLRIDTLRLCWLETFIAVSDKENISEAARYLDIDQSTVSRHMQALEKWLGKKLIEPGKIVDPQDPRVSIGITEDGRAFYAVAEKIIADLGGFRHENAVRSELVESMDQMVTSMEKDRRRKIILPVTNLVRDNVDRFRQFIAAVPEDMPIEVLKSFEQHMRSFFNRYECDRNRERRRTKKATPAPVIPAEWFEERRKQPSASSPK